MRPQDASLRAAAEPRCVMIHHRRNNECLLQEFGNQERIPQLHHLIVEAAMRCVVHKLFIIVRQDQLTDCSRKNNSPAPPLGLQNFMQRGRAATSILFLNDKPAWIKPLESTLTRSKTHTQAAVHKHQMWLWQNLYYNHSSRRNYFSFHHNLSCSSSLSQKPARSAILYVNVSLCRKHARAATVIEKLKLLEMHDTLHTRSVAAATSQQVLRNLSNGVDHALRC